jgi:hypothetical protein
MLNDADTHYLAGLVKDARTAHDAADAAEHDRDEAIRACFELGAGATELARLTGLSRARIYQIRQS